VIRTTVLLAASLAIVWPDPARAQLCPDGERMARIPAGPFWRGSDAAERRFASSLSSPAVREARWFDAELPRQRVRLDTFCIDRFLVTQSEYAAFVTTTGHRVPWISREEYLRQGFLVHDYDQAVTRFLWRGGLPPDRLEDHPVVLVSASDALAYCEWRGGRLPTEAEWEKGARGPDGRVFPWGNRWDLARLNSDSSDHGMTTPVRHYPNGESPFGLFDPVGNVFQWTASSLADGRRVVKGCAWDDEGGLCRPAFRHGRPPESRHILIGFRCALDSR
jgi:formylglycine-generating enzyme required for sulfatase activity